MWTIFVNFLYISELFFYFYLFVGSPKVQQPHTVYRRRNTMFPSLKTELAILIPSTVFWGLPDSPPMAYVGGEKDPAVGFQHDPSFCSQGRKAATKRCLASAYSPLPIQNTCTINWAGSYLKCLARLSGRGNYIHIPNILVNKMVLYNYIHQLSNTLIEMSIKINKNIVSNNQNQNSNVTRALSVLICPLPCTIISRVTLCTWAPVIQSL